ncbi:MAG: AAA family ATPase [Anaerolineales bacterium]
MTLRCRYCQSEITPGMRYCGYCGARLKDPLIYPEPQQSSQLRNITILFADLVGYTSAARQLDSEILYELVQQYTDLLSREIYKYEGVIDKITGDGVMALFGAPISYENNAERAVRAAFDMQSNFQIWRQKTKKNLGVDLDLRIGIHAGPVIVGEIGSNIVVDYTAIGETVNLAYRMEEIALPGSVLVSEQVAAQTSALFEYEEWPDLRLKGFDQALNGYRLLGIKQHPSTFRTPNAFQTPMIGREFQLNQLLAALERLETNQKSRFVLISGEAGIGKTRLLREFQQVLDQKKVFYLTAQTLTYRRAVPYWIFTDLLRSRLGLRLDSDHSHTLTMLKSALQTSSVPDAQTYLPYLEYLFALPNSDPSLLVLTQTMQADQFRVKVHEVIRSLLLKSGQKSPQVWLIEDIQWADEASINILQSILTGELPFPLLIVATTRKEISSSFENFLKWIKAQPTSLCEEIHLQNLNSQETRQLLTHLVNLEHLPQNLVQQILDQSAGIPLYLEEILRMLLDAGSLEMNENGLHVKQPLDAESLGVPITLQGLVQARFDQLEPFTRKVLQIASVIGHYFSRSILEYVIPIPEPVLLDNALKTLIERNFIIHTPNDARGEYAFRHMILSEAIYNTMLKKERSRYHALVGWAIESEYQDHIYEVTEILARHFSWSNQPEKALYYLILAAQKANALSMSDQARKHYEHALALLPLVEHVPRQSLQVHLGLAEIHFKNNEFEKARAHYQSALQEIVQGPMIDAESAHELIQQRLTEIEAKTNAAIG